MKENLKTSRTIALPNGGNLEVEFTESFANKIKKRYNTQLVTDQLILDFFRDSVSDAISNVENAETA
tara:strand:- start:570 stop:770 length:201 start_codon:yes stop_codon:yes gene_type:complete